MVDISKEIDFSEFISKNPGVQKFLQKAAKEIYDELPQEDKIRKPFIERDFQEFIIVCGLPITTQEKFPKLQQLICKNILEKMNYIQDLRNAPDQPRLWGWDENKENTNGCLILDFKTAQLAEEAINGKPGDLVKTGLNGIKLGSKNILKVFSFSEYSKVFNTPEKFVAPKLLEHKDLYQWQSGNEEHYGLQNGDRLYMYKMFHLTKEPICCLGKDDNKEDNFVQLSGVNRIEWSVNGTYLIEYLDDGFQLYGGSNMEKLNFYRHNGVKNVEFSPKEDYILSYNGNVVDTGDSDNYIIWNTNLVSVIRSFKAGQEEQWGGMQWNHDGTMIGRITPHQLHIYTLPDMKVLPEPGTQNRIPIVVKNIQKFTWVSGTNAVVTASYAGFRDFEAQTGKTVTRLSVFNLPSRNELKWKSISLDLNNVDFYSEASGKYVVAIMQIAKNKKVTGDLIHIGNLQKKNQLEVTDLKFNEDGLVKSSSFEPNTGKLGLVTSIKQKFETKVKSYEYNIHLFDIAAKSQTIKVEELPIIPIKKTPEVQWAANGTFFSLVNKDKESSQQGILELGFLSKNKEKRFQQEIFKSYDNLSYMNYASYDCTGRLVLTGSDNTNSYHLYNALGELLFKQTVNKSGLQFLQFRPRSKYFISELKKDNIVQDIKPNCKSWKEWQEEDDKIVNKKEHEEKQRKLEQEKQFLAYLDKKQQIWKDTKKDRIALRGFDEEDFGGYVEETVFEREEILETGIVEEQK